jgi:outer membrane protein assembly factor BamB
MKGADETELPAQVGYRLDSSLSGLELEVLRTRVKEEEFPIADFGIGGSVATSPIVHRGVVYFGACDEKFYAVDAETGRKIWSFPTDGPINSSPVLNSGVIYFGSYDHNLYAITLDGKLLWRFPTQGKIFSKPCVHKGVVYFGSWDGNLYAVDARTGRERWRFGTNKYILSWPVVHNDTVYFGSNDYNFYALSLDGRLKWKFGTGRETGLFNSVVHDGVVYFYSFDRNLYAVSADTGRLLWRFQISEPPNTVIARKGDMLFFGSRNCNFYCVTTGGKHAWTFHSGGVAGGGVSVFGDAVYFNGEDNTLYAIDAESGRLVWEFHAGGIIAHTSPAFCNDRIYFGCWDCNLYCITMEGRLVWKFKTSLSYTAPFFLESEKQKTFQVVWKPLHEERWSEEKKEGRETGDYGDFRGGYIGEDMRDYMGEPLREGGPAIAYKATKRAYKK